MSDNFEAWKEYEKKRTNDYIETKVICKCGRRLPIPVYKDEVTCKWCGRVVKNTSRLYFRNKVMEAINKLEMEEGK